MSDFLDNLLGRTLARTPVLEPRRPSLFEPVAGALGATRAAWLGPTDAAASPPPDENWLTGVSADRTGPSPGEASAAPASWAGARPRGAGDAAGTREPATWSQGDLQTIVADRVRAAMPVRPSPTIADTHPDDRPPDTPRNARSADDRTGPVSIIVHRHETWQPNLVPPSPPAAKAKEDSGMPRRAARRDEADASLSVPPPGLTRPPVEAAPSSSRRAQSPPPPRAEEPAAVKRARATPAPGRRRAPPPVDTASFPVRRPDQAPAPAPVQVTIGRVEIRATRATASTPGRVARPGPQLSLDEYLRSRNEGSR